MADLRLTDTVDAAKTLFDAVRVPGQIVVDHQVGALQVDPFAGGICGQQHLHSGSNWKDSCIFVRSSRPILPWITTTASLRPNSVVMRFSR